MHFWVRIFTATFAIGVATGITMEFSFGTNWADYSRFVGDIFGAPLAAEALFAFFLESVFLGRASLRSKRRCRPSSTRCRHGLCGQASCLSALWILIANSWMQTPAGAELTQPMARRPLSPISLRRLSIPRLLPRYYARDRGAAHFGRVRVAWRLGAMVFAEGQALRFCDENRAHWCRGRHRRLVRDDCDRPRVRRSRCPKSSPPSWP